MKTLSLATVLAFVLAGVIARDWNVEGLYSYTKLLENNNRIIDPESFLTDSTNNFIEKQMLKTPDIKTHDIKTHLIILDTIDRSYYSSVAQKIDIVKFLEEFIFEFYPQIEQRNNTLFIIYSIEDRVYRYRTGVNVRSIFSDSFLDSVAESLVPELRTRAYDSAFKKLFVNLYEKPSILPFILFALAVTLIVLCLIYSCIDQARKVERAKTLNKRFKTLEQLKTEGKDINLFIQENCAICLDKLENREYPSESQYKELKEVFLDCGHNFHKNCLKDWLKASDKCPLCRKLVNADKKDNNTLLDALSNMQRTYYTNYFTTTEVTRIIDSTDGNFWEAYRQEYGTNNSTNYTSNDCNYDNNSGGTYGSW